MVRLDNRVRHDSCGIAGCNRLEGGALANRLRQLGQRTGQDKQEKAKSLEGRAEGTEGVCCVICEKLQGSGVVGARSSDLRPRWC
jgi:hypothetical protein